MSLNKKLFPQGATGAAGPHFNIVTWTGDDQNNRGITGVGFQPGMIWLKKRNSATNAQWIVVDSVRGADRTLNFASMDKQYPLPGAGTAGYVPSFDTDGFTVSNSSIVNGSGFTYVAFCFKLTQTTSTNNDGARSATIAVNDDLGLSVSTHTANNNNTATTVGHGLSATPDFLIAKNLSNDTRAWRLFNRSSPSNKETFSLPSAEAAYSFFADPTSSIINIPVSTTVGTSSSDTPNGSIIAFWAMRNTNFMQFGTYTGSSGTVTVSGLPFQPRFVVRKNLRGNSSDRMYVQDTVRGINQLFYFNATFAEADTSGNPNLTITTDGFTVPNNGDTAINNSGDTFFYWAIA